MSFKIKQPKKKRKVFIAAPCYTGTVALATHKALMHDVFKLALQDIEVRIFDEIGHADIYLLRAQLLQQFLDDEEATDYVMVDADVGWEPDGLLKLLRHDVDLVAGCYPKRKDPITFMFLSDLDNGGTLSGDPETGLVEVHGMPCGFMRCTRSMVEKMIEHYGPTMTAIDGYSPNKKVVRLFDPYWDTMDDGQKRVLSEDYAFCRRWRDIGGKVYLDASIGMAHIGFKAYHGRLGEFVNSKIETTE